MPESKQDKTPAKKVSVTLKKPHTHQRTEHKVGDKIEVREDQAKRLREAEII